MWPTLFLIKLLILQSEASKKGYNMGQHFWYLKRGISLKCPKNTLIIISHQSLLLFDSGLQQRLLMAKTASAF